MNKIEEILLIISVLCLGVSNLYLQYRLCHMRNLFVVTEYFISRNVIEIDNLWQYINAALVPEDVPTNDRRDLSFAISMNHYLTKEDRDLFETKLKETQTYIQKTM